MAVSQLAISSQALARLQHSDVRPPPAAAAESVSPHSVDLEGFALELCQAMVMVGLPVGDGLAAA